MKNVLFLIFCLLMHNVTSMERTSYSQAAYSTEESLLQAIYTQHIDPATTSQSGAFIVSSIKFLARAHKEFTLPIFQRKLQENIKFFIGKALDLESSEPAQQLIIQDLRVALDEDCDKVISAFIKKELNMYDIITPDDEPNKRSCALL